MVNIHIKGAPDALLPLATGIAGEFGKFQDLTEERQQLFIEAVDSMAGNPLRVIAFAYASIEKPLFD